MIVSDDNRRLGLFQSRPLLVVIWRVLCLSVSFSLLVSLHGAYSEPQSTQQIFQGQSINELGSKMRFSVDDGATPDEWLIRAATGQINQRFSVIKKTVLPYQAVWGAIPVNVDGAMPDEWRIVPEIDGLVEFGAWFVDVSGSAQSLASYSARTAFDPKAFSGLRLSSAPIRLNPGQNGVFVVRLVFGATMQNSMRLETSEDHASRTTVSTAIITGFYAFSAASITFFCLFSVAMRSAVGVLYGVLLSFGLLFIAYLDQLTFRFFYPNSPELHLPFGLGLLFVISGTCFGIAAWSLWRAGSRTFAFSTLCATMTGAFGCAAATPFLSAEVLAPISYMLLPFGLVSVMFFLRYGDISPGKGSRTLELLVLFCGIACAILIGALLTGWGSATLSYAWATKVVFGVLAFWIIAALSFGLLDMRRDTERALRREVGALEKEAHANRERLEAEQRYAQARDLAAMRQRQLATASHDLRQPLSSLRMTFDTLAKEVPQDARERLDDALAYLHDIAANYMREARPAETQGSDQAKADVDASAEEPYEIGLILRTIQQMFEEEARAENVNLRLDPSALMTTAPPLIVMRIVSNLVSNAIKHSTGGTVLSKVDQTVNSICLQIIDDGSGMTESDLARFNHAYGKSETSDGEGLGLAICHELAVNHGFDLHVISKLAKGTTFQLSLPAAEVVGT